MERTRAGGRPTIADVARLAGVSVSLVSLALNNREGVSPTTKARILAVADQVGYHADPQARALRRGSSEALGLVVRNLSNPYFLDVITGAQEAAARHGRTVLVADADYSPKREQDHLRRLAAQRVEGLAIAPVGTGRSVRLWRELRPGSPVVVLNATARAADAVARVGPDNQRAVELAVRHLAELGHEEIAFLTAPRRVMADHDRLIAFYAECAALGIKPRPVETPLNLVAVHRRVLALLDERPPTAIITNSDYTAHAVYKAARDRGLRVGRDLSVVGHDDLPTSELLDRPLTSVRVDARAIGRALVRALLNHETATDHREPVELIVRESTCPPRGRRRSRRAARGRGPLPFRTASNRSTRNRA
ncbi:LacI family DNA-binding transcriptional regulator [Thermasporomyces composti]|uniref:LacI family transcriptional regulator n=1 Tax=Thermasporomyces composti TaxID=696763 RepID=A0A3D9VFK7_THECX|nr:LacI family DNA-binding transcriptional regulator [Thermasporomyces composti]REF36934.1 LacI family transcriptional regulator [Thermasporomyces composti]